MSARGEAVPQVASVVARRGGWLVRWLWVWMSGHRRMCAAWLAVSVVASWVRGEPVLTWVAVGLTLPLALAGWAWCWPAGYERVLAGPSRRRRWRRYIRRNWTGLADACGWTRSLRATDAGHVGTRMGVGRSLPRLRSVRAHGSTVMLVVRSRPGQTLDQLEAGVPGLAATMDALSWRCTAHRGSSSTLLVELVMHDALRDARAGVNATVHLHDLRHTGNHFAAASGASTRDLMHRMGHASMRAALIYQHATAERDARIAETLNRVYSGHGER